jgi:hypothetical protein
MFRVFSFTLVFTFAVSSFAGDLGCRQVYYSTLENMKPAALKAQKISNKDGHGLVGAIVGGVAAGAASIYAIHEWYDHPRDQGDAFPGITVSLATVFGALAGNAIGNITPKSLKKAKAEASRIIDHYNEILRAIELVNDADILVNHRTDASAEAWEKASRDLRFYGIDEAHAPRLLEGEASGQICPAGQVMTASELSAWVNTP